MNATVFVQAKLDRKTDSVHTKHGSSKISLALNDRQKEQERKPSCRQRRRSGSLKDVQVERTSTHVEISSTRCEKEKQSKRGIIL